MTQTVYTDIAKLQAEILETVEMPPLRTSAVLVELTALYATLITELRESEFAYKAVLLTCLDSEEAANRAKIRAENSEAYRRMRLAKDTEKVVVELIRSLKVSLRTMQEEMRMTR